MKDLLIITSYTPDNIRKNILRNFINQIDKKRYDLMVCSHSEIPTDLFEEIDYFIYDKENLLLKSFEHKYSMYWKNNDFEIHTTEARDFNHFLAAYKLVFSGLSNAKIMGYSKAHVIEYDTSIVNMNEFDENSEILNEYDIVKYSTDYTPTIISFPMSFNIEKINHEWFEFDKDKLFNFVESNPYKTIEEYENYLLSKESNVYSKSYKVLKENGLDINLYFSGSDLSWYCPVVNSSNDTIMFIDNKNNEPVNISVIINYNEIKNFYVNPKHWYMNTIKNFDEVENLTILKNNKPFREYDFLKIDKENYKSKNYIT